MAAGLDPSTYGTHSMRRTKATLIYKRTKNQRFSADRRISVQLFRSDSSSKNRFHGSRLDVVVSLRASEKREKS